MEHETIKLEPTSLVGVLIDKGLSFGKASRFTEDGDFVGRLIVLYKKSKGMGSIEISKKDFKIVGTVTHDHKFDFDTLEYVKDLNISTIGLLGGGADIVFGLLMAKNKAEIPEDKKLLILKIDD